MGTPNRSKIIVLPGLLVLFLALLLVGLIRQEANSHFAEPAQGESDPQRSEPIKNNSSPAAPITVSGIVSGPGGPVPGVWVGIGAHQDFQEAITDGSGSYSVSINADGELWFHVRPDIATRLAMLNFWVGGITSSFTQNITLSAGYLLRLQLLGSGGSPVLAGDWLEAAPISGQPDNQWHGLERAWDGSQTYRAVLPPDIYYVRVNNVPAGYFATAQGFDLRAADQNKSMSLNTEYVHPIPFDPPDASKISLGAVDDLGEAIVTGTAGAALPLAHVILVNLNSTHQADTVSEADGSFGARIYAPPGSAIMIKHGPPGHRWNDLEVGVSEGLNPFPGTILNVPHTHDGGPTAVPFAAAGAIEFLADDPNSTRNNVRSAWAISGTMGPLVVDGEWTRVLTGTYDGQVVPGLYLGGLNWTHPALGDLDDDGDLDLVVGERSGQLVLYRNRGSATIPEWRFDSAALAGVETGDWAYPALVDVTNDGAADLLVGTGRGTVAIYYNAGSPSLPQWPAAPDLALSAGYQAAPTLDDLDGDGDLDLLVGHAGGSMYHFENTGTIAAPIWTARTSAYGGISEAGDWLQPAFVDLDGDSDRDLLVGLCGQLIWYRRGGTPASPMWTRVGSDPIGYGGGSCATSPGVGNWDGDGDIDLVVGEHWGTWRFFRNDGAPAWSEQSFSFPIDLAGDSAPALTDWDDDGDLDLLLGQAHGAIERYTNVGTASNPAWRPEGTLLNLPWTNHPHPFPTFADIDGDGDQDLFVGEGGWQGAGAGGNIHFYRNDGTTSIPNWVSVSTSFLGLDVGGWSTPAFVDIDNDDDLDLFVGDEQGSLTFVENTGTAVAPSWAAPNQPYAGLELGRYSAPAFFDVDQDGDLDILVGLEHGSLAYVRNTGTVSQPVWSVVSTSYPDIDIGEQATPSAADINNDGQPDLLMGDGDGGLNVYLYKGPGNPPAPGATYAAGDLFQIKGAIRLHSPGITTTTDLEAIDVNGGLDSLMLFGHTGKALATQNYFMSTILTPSGFPIQRSERPTTWLGNNFQVGDLAFAGAHVIEGSFTASGQIPDDMAAGIYRPVISLGFTGVPTSSEWLAANVTQYTFGAHEAALPPITVGSVDAPRLSWRLLMDDFVQGTRGTNAREDQGSFELASQIVSQGAPYYAPPVDARSGQPIGYRLEPFVPMLSFTDRRMPAPPLIPFDLPGGQLCVTIKEPDRTVRALGCEALGQSFNRTKTTRAGSDLNGGTVQLEDVYSLMGVSDRFRVTFDQFGQHVITMTGVISDVWGNAYRGGGTYEVWMAHPLDIDPGVLPGTPLAVGDRFNPTLQFYPRVPARVRMAITHYPDSDPTQAVIQTRQGAANDYGYFGAESLTLAEAGEYRVDIRAIFTDTAGQVYMGAMTWGGIVMTPDHAADLIAHGRRGLDSLQQIPNHWFVAGRDLNIPAGAISHALNPYFNGDMLWSRLSDEASGGNALIMGASVQDTVGTIEAAVQTRANRVYPPLSAPGDLSERLAKGEVPLFISTLSGRPAQMALGQLDAQIPGDVDQIAYSYRTSQRPGVRVREVVAEDGQSGGYWRLDTLYDDQLGVGVLGDQANDFKFQYVGAVYRDLQTGVNEYVGQGSGWVFIPEDDPLGNRVMPPFAGPGNGGWTNEGGPILTLKGQEVHMFILPTGVRPGAVLEVGDRFNFAGHIMPTLNSMVAITATAPSGTAHVGGGRANRIGYFYDANLDFTVNEPGLWAVDVRVWHDGTCSGGQVDCDPAQPFDPARPCPSGDVLGSAGGRYWFYVVAGDSPRLNVSSPTPGFISFGDRVTPITITGFIPVDLSGVTIDFTISMPGFILEQGQATRAGSSYQIVFDPVKLNQTFPNIDLLGRDEWRAGLADTFAIGILLRGQSGGHTVYRANTITFQGEQVFVGDGQNKPPQQLYLPLVLKGN